MEEELVFNSCPAYGELAIGAADLDALDAGELRRLEVERLAADGASANAIALIDFLGDPDWRVRRAAAMALAADPDTDPSALLCERLASEDAGERNAAIKVLIKRGADSIPALLEALRSPDPDVRNFACVALGKVGDSAATEPLLALVADDSDANVRYMAIEAVGRIGDPRAIDVLIALLDEDAWFAAPAAEALGSLGCPRALAALGERLTDDDIALVAIGALGSTGDPRGLVPLLEAGRHAGILLGLPLIDAMGTILAAADEDVFGVLDLLRPVAQRLFSPELRTALETALAAPGDARIKALHVAAWLGDPSLTPVVCPAAEDSESIPLVVAHLTRDFPLTMPYLADGLRNPYPAVRIAIAESIGRALATRALDLVTKLLEDRNQAVVIAAIETLALIGTPADARHLVPLLSSELDETRAAAALAFGELGVSAVQKDLARLAGSGSPRVRGSLARALALAPDIADAPESRDALLSLAGDPDPHVRACIAPALARIDSPEALPTLLNLALDESESVRLAATRSLDRSAGDAATRMLRTACDDRSTAVRTAAIRGLASPLAEEDVPLVAELLADADTGTVLSALGGLGSVTGQGVVNDIVRLLGHGSDDVRETALRTLRQVSPEQARDLAAVVLSGSEPAWNVRLAAVEALAGWDGSLGGRELIERALADEEPIVRRAAVALIPGAFGADAVGLLVALLDDAELAPSARAALIDMDAPVIIELESAIERTSGPTRRALTLALGSIDCTAARNALERLARICGDDERWWAVTALARDGRGSHPDLAGLSTGESDTTTRAVLDALVGVDAA
jgi:HEAT repeat protein